MQSQMKKLFSQLSNKAEHNVFVVLEYKAPIDSVRFEAEKKGKSFKLLQIGEDREKTDFGMISLRIGDDITVNAISDKMIPDLFRLEPIVGQFIDNAMEKQVKKFLKGAVFHISDNVLNVEDKIDVDKMFTI